MSCANEETPAFDRKFSRYDEGVNPGLAVMAIEKGVTKFKKGYGLRDLETREKVDSDTNFRMASVSKQFTAMCIAILEERKQLAMDDLISQYFADLPEYMRAIKIRHLVHHLSGLPDYADELWSSNKSRPLISNHDIYDFYKKQKKLDFEVGERFEYSNGGYSLLPLLIECITHQSFPEFVESNIFKPAGMSNTAIIQYPSRIRNQAKSYSEWPFFADIDFNTGNALQGEDGVYTSLTDMEAWIRALENNTLVSAGMTRTIFTKGRDNKGREVSYGYGWEFDKIYGHNVILHGGSWVGFNTIILKVPDNDIWFVAFSNSRAIDSDHALIEMAKHYLDLDSENM